MAILCIKWSRLVIFFNKSGFRTAKSNLIFELFWKWNGVQISGFGLRTLAVIKWTKSMDSFFYIKLTCPLGVRCDSRGVWKEEAEWDSEKPLRGDDLKEIRLLKILETEVTKLSFEKTQLQWPFENRTTRYSNGHFLDTNLCVIEWLTNMFQWFENRTKNQIYC
jgi:hypothetical protein